MEEKRPSQIRGEKIAKIVTLGIGKKVKHLSRRRGMLKPLDAD